MIFPLVYSARLKIISILAKSRPPLPNLYPDERKALKELQHCREIIILPSDKGRTSVVLDQCEYDRNHMLLSDANTYMRLDKDPTPSLERRMNSTLWSLTKNGELPRQLYNTLRSSAGNIPHLYGLPKIHKPGTPLRPIVSFVDSPSYQLSKHLSELLVGKSHSAVKNSGEFADFLRPYRTVNC